MYPLLISLLILGAMLPLAAQDAPKLEKTPFWEISGNGLREPSYLFAVLEARDGRLFNISDSVISKFNACGTFMIGAAPDSLLHATFTRVLRSMDTSQSDLQVSWDATGNDSIIDVALPRPVLYAQGRGLVSLQDNGKRKIPAGFWFDGWLGIEEPLRPDERTYTVSAYLYGLAEARGVRRVSLERAEELFAQNDSLRALDPADVVRPDDESLGFANLKKTFVEHYLRGDIERIFEMMRGAYSDRMFKLMVNARNRVIADRMVTQMREGSAFIMIGLVHLPGKDGLVAMLRAQGFTVRPIYLKPGAAPLPTISDTSVPWHRFHSSVGAFSVEMPYEPVSFPYSGGGREASTKGITVACPDLIGGIIYSAQQIDLAVNPATPHNLNTVMMTMKIHDISGFEDVQGMNSVLSDERPKSIQLDGMEGLEDKLTDDFNLVSRYRIYQRGNRYYVLRVSSTPDRVRSPEAERFFASFKVHDLQEHGWRLFRFRDAACMAEFPEVTAGEFKLPSPLYPHDGIEISGRDPGTGDFYSIECTRYGRFFEAVSEDSLLKEAIQNAYMGELIKPVVTPIADGDVRGWEALLDLPSRMGIVRRTRFQRHGDRLYRLEASVPRERAFSPAVERFFRSFRVIEDSITGDPFSYKGDMLLDAIAADDFSQREDLLRAAGHYPFAPRHLPRIYELLRRTYPDAPGDSTDPDRPAYLSEMSGTYQMDIREALVRHLGRIHDSTTVEFIRDNYSLSDYDHGYDMLHALIEIGTDRSAALLVDLLRDDTSNLRGYNATTLGHLENVELKKAAAFIPYIPELFKVVGDEPGVYHLLARGLDSGMVPPEILRAVEKRVLPFILSTLELQGEDEDEDDVDWNAFIRVGVQVLVYTEKSPEALNVLRMLMMTSKDPGTRLAAAEALLRYGPVSTELLQKSLDDRRSRAGVYRLLARKGVIEKIPAKYHDQRSIAEGLLHEWWWSRYQEVLSEYLEDRPIDYKGAPARLYAFKCQMTWRTSGPWHVGIVIVPRTGAGRASADPLLVTAGTTELEEMSLDEHIRQLLQAE